MYYFFSFLVSYNSHGCLYDEINFCIFSFQSSAILRWTSVEQGHQQNVCVYQRHGNHSTWRCWMTVTRLVRFFSARWSKNDFDWNIFLSRNSDYIITQLRFYLWISVASHFDLTPFYNVSWNCIDIVKQLTISVMPRIPASSSTQAAIERPEPHVYVSC